MSETSAEEAEALFERRAEGSQQFFQPLFAAASFYAEYLERVGDAIDAERRLKGWSRAKKEASIRGDWDDVQRLARRPGARARAGPAPT